MRIGSRGGPDQVCLTGGGPQKVRLTISGRPAGIRYLLYLAFCVVFAAPALAQEPRSSEADVTASQAVESGSGDGFIAKAKRWADETQIVERISGDVDGWYPRLGGMTRGSGFSIGPGYRTHLFSDRIFVDTSASLSVKRYTAADVNVRWLQLFQERVELWTNFRYEDFPQEDFFGRGMSSSLDNRVSYDFDSVDFAVRGLFRPKPWLRLAAGIGYMSPDVGSGSDRKYPSIEQLFADAVVPGLVAQPDFMHTTFSAEVRTLDVPGNPRSGGSYRATFSKWDDRTLEQYDFGRLDVLFTHYVPLTPGKTHVLSGRIGTSYVNSEAGDRVPFYFLPYVGGRDTIRSLHEFRFKDENAIWLGAEYRWIPIKWVSLAAFADAGKVSADWEDIDFRNLEQGYGFGFRVHSSTQTFAAVDFATGGGEGWRFFLKLGPAF